MTSRKFSFNFCMVFCSINLNSLSKTEKYSKHFLNRRIIITSNAHRMKYFKCQVRLPNKLMVIFCVLCIARECQSIAYIGNLANEESYIFHTQFLRDRHLLKRLCPIQWWCHCFWGIFFFITDTNCLFLHSLITPSSTSRLNFFLDWVYKKV